MKRSPIDHARPKRWKYDDFRAKAIRARLREPAMVRDRATIVAIAITQIITKARLTPAELRLRIAEYLRDEIATIEQEIATDQREVPDDA